MADNKEITEKILNKKFKKVVFSGYDTVDVDSFFDEIIAYLNNNDQLLANHIAASKELKAQVEQLQAQVKQLKEENKKLSDQVVEYESEGYGTLFSKHKSQAKKGE